MLNINRLIWDQWNIAHIAHHDVFAGEVEEVCHGEPKVSDTYDGRLRVVGPTVLGKILTVILAPKNESVYYVVTARTADRQERRQYKESKGGEKSS